MTYTVDSADGHQTNFGFSESKSDSTHSEQMKSILAGLLPESAIEEMSFAWVCKHLKDGNDVNGWWFSSDSDPARAKQDIAQRIRDELGLQATIKLFDDAGGV